MEAEEREWIARCYQAPSPTWIKRSVLLRLGIKNATWVETGTFIGDTTALLARESRAVHTIEPQRTLFEQAELRFRDDSRVNVIHGLSEDVFPILLPT
jgi:protein-L-isoaspartate O-methyltransferase